MIWIIFIALNALLIFTVFIFVIVLLLGLWEKRRFRVGPSDNAEYQPPDDIARPLFLEWRSPRRGTANPQDMTNDVWKWIVEKECNAYQVDQAFHGPSSIDAGPCWCFERLGQSETTLPDGRIVCIAGEHEDYYDPDFYIYNDVVIIDTANKIRIFAYPVTDFPPTDFHTATLVGNEIVLIGNLGYPNDRQPGRTQVLRLNIDTWSVSLVETFGDAPGWIHEHKAELSADQNEIRIVGGMIYRDNQTPLIENIDEWSLDLQAWQWKRLTRRRWPQFMLYRKDQKPNHLSEMRQITFWERITQYDKKYEKEYDAAKKD